jgi:hypothetical protein
MKYIKHFENINLKKIDLDKNIIGKSPYLYLYTKPDRIKDYNFVIEKLKDILIGKIVHFVSRKYTEGTVTNIIKNDVEVVNVAYDNDNGNNIIYVKLKNDNEWYSISDNEIFINVIKTNANKYNL